MMQLEITLQRKSFTNIVQLLNYNPTYAEYKSLFSQVFEAIQPDFLVSPEGNAMYKGVEWKINGECVTAPSMRGCGIR